MLRSSNPLKSRTVFHGVRITCRNSLGKQPSRPVGPPPTGVCAVGSLHVGPHHRPALDTALSGEPLIFLQQFRCLDLYLTAVSIPGGTYSQGRLLVVVAAFD